MYLLKKNFPYLRSDIILCFLLRIIQCVLNSSIQSGFILYIAKVEWLFFSILTQYNIFNSWSLVYINGHIHLYQIPKSKDLFLDFLFLLKWAICLWMANTIFLTKYILFLLGYIFSHLLSFYKMLFSKLPGLFQSICSTSFCLIAEWT